MNTDELHARAEALLGELTVITERFGDNPDLMPVGQRTRYENIQRGLAAVDGDLRAAEAVEERTERLRQAALDPRNRESSMGPAYGQDPTIRRRSNPWLGLDLNLRAESMSGYRQRALDCIEVLPGVPTDRRAALSEMIDSDATSRSALFTLVASDPAYARAFTEILKDPVRGHLMWGPEERDAYARVESMRTALSLTDANGGFLVPLSLDPTVILSNAGSTNPFRRIARIEQTASESHSFSVSAGVTAEWLAEATEAADGSPTFSRVTVPVEKLASYVYGSYEVLADTNLVSQLPRILQDSFANSEASAFATGSGSGQPKGVITAVAAVTASRVAPTTGGVFTTASVADVYKVHTALTARSRNDSSMAWLANIGILNVIRQMDTSGGSAFWANLGEATPPRLLGHPVYESSAMTSVTTTGSAILIGGSFVDYGIVDRLGVTMVYIPSIAGANQRPTGQAGWFAYKRVGADTLNADSFRVLQL